nr:hypothetical protein BaRGS_017579 [Batillaria attramentaria]
MTEIDNSEKPFLCDRDQSVHMAGGASGENGRWKAPVSRDGEVQISGLENTAEEGVKQDQHKVIYTVEDVPPIYMWPVYALQLLSIALFMCGVSTLLQTTIGVR